MTTLAGLLTPTGTVTAQENLTTMALRLGAIMPAETRTTAQALDMDSSIDAILTAGYSAAGDGGGGLYKRVGSEPSHAGKLQTADASWFELTAVNGRWSAEQFGAVNGISGDNLAALNSALAATAATGNTLVAKGGYLISDTLTFPAGRYGFEGPDYRRPGVNLDRGFVWNGTGNKAIVELLDWTESRCTSLVVSNSATSASQATGVTGILAHNPDGTGASITNLHFDFIGVYGCNVGLQIGDFTNDTFDSNWEQNVIENIHFYDVANPLVIDSDALDNIIIKTFHNGGPTSLSAHVGTRSHVIYIKRSGQAHYFGYIFMRVDGITTDNAAIRVDDGSFNCDFCNMEGTATCRLLDINSNALTRSQNVIRQMCGIDAQVDSSGRSMILASKTGAVLIGCAVGGNIECQRPVTAIGTVFKTGANFTTTGSGEVIALGTRMRTDSGSALTADSGRIETDDVALRRNARFNSAAINAGNLDVITGVSIAAGTCHRWEVRMEATNDLQGVFRFYVWRNAAGTITGKQVTDYETATGTTITVTDTGSATYKINIANSQANDKFYAGQIEVIDTFTI